MSAFVMLPEGFNQLMNELAVRADSLSRTCDENYSVTRDVREFLGFERHFDVPEPSANQRATERALQLFRANVEAVCQRYEHMSEEERGLYPEPAFSRTSYWPQWSNVQLVKHLSCLRYQMSEGEIPETESYKRLSKLIGDISESILMSSPEYDKARWDF